MNKLVKSVNKNDLVTEFLISLNGILRLTDRELELMAEFIRLDLNYNKQPNENKNILSRYIKSFKQKGILVAGPAEDELSVNKALIPEIIGDRVQVTIIIRINDETISN